MARFRKKAGAVGWPGPQTRQIIRRAERYQITVDEHEAQTGTRYLFLLAPDGADITVRVADHADAYASADFTVDPAQDDRAPVFAWIEAHGERKARRRPWPVREKEFRAEAAWRGLTIIECSPRLLQAVRDNHVVGLLNADGVDWE